MKNLPLTRIRTFITWPAFAIVGLCLVSGPAATSAVARSSAYTGDHGIKLTGCLIRGEGERTLSELLRALGGGYSNN